MTTARSLHHWIVAAAAIALLSFVILVASQQSQPGELAQSPSTTPSVTRPASTTDSNYVTSVSTSPVGYPLSSAAITPLPTLTSSPPLPTWTLAPPTPVLPITSWLTYTNTFIGYQISYPNTWFLSESGAKYISITSFRTGPIQTGFATVAVVLIEPGTMIVRPTSALSETKQYCIDAYCGVRVDALILGDPQYQDLNRIVQVEIPRGGGHTLLISAGIANPPADAARNAILVEQIIASLLLINAPSTPTSTPTATPSATPTAVPPIPVSSIDDWLTYTNPTQYFTFRYPANWYIYQEVPQQGIILNSFDAGRQGGSMSSHMDPLQVPLQHVSISILLHGAADISPLWERFCIHDFCAFRGTVWSLGRCDDPICEMRKQRFNRQISVGVPRGLQGLLLTATISNPPDAAERNAAVVERVVTSLEFIK